MSQPISAAELTFKSDSLLTADMNDDITNQLANAGTVGIAAAAAVATGRKRKRHYTFETNPSIRRRLQTRLLRKLRDLLDEYTIRVGQQAIIVCCTPGKASGVFKAFGAQPLEEIVRNLRQAVTRNLESMLQQQAPPQPQLDSGLFDLPPLVCDGIPTPVDKMTQAQLRAFVPLMLKYSTGRGKPGWGRDSTRPVWWPKDLPWQNVRSDARSEVDKRELSWTEALRRIIRSCYKYHDREDLLLESDVNELKRNDDVSAFYRNYPIQQVIHITNADGTVTVVPIEATQVASLAETGNQAEATVQVVASLADVPVTTQPSVIRRGRNTSRVQHNLQ